MRPLRADDLFAIEDRLSLYHWALDTGDVDGFADLFVESGAVVVEVRSRTRRYEGREGLIDLVESLRTWDLFPGCQHYAGQVLIEGDASRCRVRSYCLVAECRGEPPYAIRFTGRSDDRMVCRDGRWLFEERIVRLWPGAADGAHVLSIGSLLQPSPEGGEH
jgi:hypothetical protein